MKSPLHMLHLEVDQKDAGRVRAASGELRAVLEHKGVPIRMAIADVIMPQMGGVVMAEWLKPQFPNLKFFFTSGYMEKANLHHDVLKPGVMFLARPCTPATLTHKVRELPDTP